MIYQDFVLRCSANWIKLIFLVHVSGFEGWHDFNLASWELVLCPSWLGKHLHFCWQLAGLCRPTCARHLWSLASHDAHMAPEILQRRGMGHCPQQKHGHCQQNWLVQSLVTGFAAVPRLNGFFLRHPMAIWKCLGGVFMNVHDILEDKKY